MKLNKILVVHDPIHEEQPALARAAVVANEVGASLHLFACIHEDISGADRGSEETKRLLEQHQASMEKLLAPIIAMGITTTTEVEWDRDWHHAVVRAATRSHADMVFKSSFRHSSSRRMLKQTSDWILIRECLCPVLLIKNTEPPAVPRILAGIDIQAKAESYEKLNQHIVEFSRQLVASERTEVHVVNAFQNFRGVPDRQKLIDVSGVDSNQIHIKMGTPDQVIVDTAKKIDASLVIVGNSHRSGLAALLHGNTAEKILDKLDCNVLAMP